MWAEIALFKESNKAVLEAGEEENNSELVWITNQSHNVILFLISIL